MRKISIFIPVYRYSELLGASLKSLIRDPYKNKEIFVIIDEPAKKSLELVKEYGDKARFVLNGKRAGKVNALNEAVELSRGDILLFLDDDVKIPNPENFLACVADELQKADLVQFKQKTARKSFLAKIASYDDIGFNFVYFTFSKLLRKCPGVSGPAFAIRRNVFQEIGGFRRVIQDDFDIGIRAFLKDKKFKYVRNIEVLIDPPHSWKEWFKQRKRWGVGTAICIKNYYRQFLRIAIKYPQVLVPAMFFMFPTLTLFLLNCFVYSPLMENFLIIPMMFVSAHFSILIPIMSFVSMGVAVTKNIALSFATFGISSILFYPIARNLDITFNPLEFAIYFFFYCPIWLLIVIVSFIRVFVFSKHSLVDWKV